MSSIRIGDDPAEVLRALSKGIHDETQGAMFVTCVVGLFDLEGKTRSLTQVRACSLGLTSLMTVSSIPLANVSEPQGTLEKGVALLFEFGCASLLGLSAVQMAAAKECV